LIPLPKHALAIDVIPLCCSQTASPVKDAAEGHSKSIQLNSIKTLSQIMKEALLIVFAVPFIHTYLTIAVYGSWSLGIDLNDDWPS
jgi:hypothetical protein